jgi:predicted transcriptional regulator of viral defense system
LTSLVLRAQNQEMPRTRMDELFALAEEHDGLLTSKEARAAGIQDSVLVRLAQRGRLERMTRGVYRIAHYPTDRLAQYREAVLWAKASQGPEHIALSHETALLLYGISDANPSRVNLTVPTSARLRRKSPEWVSIHRANLPLQDIGEHEGLPVTTVSRSIIDVLLATRRTDVARQSVSEALREGLLNNAEASVLRRSITRTSSAPSPSNSGSQVNVHDAAAS